MRHPLLLEINTRCWLRELSAKAGKPVTLGAVPETILRQWRRWGITHIWLMGVWSGGPRARGRALNDAGLRAALSAALPGCTDEDIGASPYAIADYRVPAELGGVEGMLELRCRLREFEIRLVLDFVPNHMGLDHPWLHHHPERFVQSESKSPGTFPQTTSAGIHWLAHGKDPHFPPWTDTVQLDYRRADTRAAMIERLMTIAKLCDGVRCDMAMLVLNDVFARTWSSIPPAGSAPTGAPATEFWTEAINAVRAANPGFLFMAEAYWGLEPRLQDLGFDYTYDKSLYDKIVARDTAAIRRHVFNTPARRLTAGVHFLENHDEPRIASLLAPAEQEAAALLIASLPGMRFLHEGQLTGARVRSPVQLLRRPSEPEYLALERFYDTLLGVLPKTAVGQGNWIVLDPASAWDANPTYQNFVIVQWQAHPPEFDLAVVNLAPYQSQCYVKPQVAKLAASNWRLINLVGAGDYLRPGGDLAGRGLYLDLPAHGAQLFHFTPA